MKARTSFRRRIISFLLLLILGSALFYYFLSLPIWKIQEINITGTSILSTEEIKNLSGIPLSENLFFTSFRRAYDNLKQIAVIKEFHLYRIPPGTVLVKITERRPVAIFLISGRSVIVDEDGYILNRTPGLTLNIPNMTDLPVIFGVGSREVLEGVKIDPRVAPLVSHIALKLSGLLGSRRIRLELGENISFLLDDILRVKLGRDENVKRKMEVFEGLLPAIAGRWPEIEYVDVRFPDNPVVKYR